MISLRQLQLIMRLGDLGIQYALMSERAFSAIRFRDWKQARELSFIPNDLSENRMLDVSIWIR